ncbi:gypsy/ty3 retroelement polyprotein [Tanacetum coccineum]
MDIGNDRQQRMLLGAEFMTIYNKCTNGVSRTKNMITGKWNRMHPDCQKFHAIYKGITRKSSENDGDVLEAAKAEYSACNKGKKFAYEHGFNEELRQKIQAGKSAYEAKKVKEQSATELNELQFLTIDADSLPEPKKTIIKNKQAQIMAKYQCDHPYLGWVTYYGRSHDVSSLISCLAETSHGSKCGYYHKSAASQMRAILTTGMWLQPWLTFYLAFVLATIQLASIHLYGAASLWHRQFVKLMGGNASWDLIKKVDLLRFGSAYDDPMADIKNLRHTGTIKEYQNAFYKLISRIDLPEDQQINFYIAGLQSDVELVVRMYRPKSLAEVYHLSKIQEAAIKVNKQRYKRPMLPTPRFISNQQTQNPQNSNVVKQFPVPNTTLAAKSSFNTPYPKRQLTQKEFQERRAKNLCFYCDQKYTPGHSCRGQVLNLEVVADVFDTCYEDSTYN